MSDESPLAWTEDGQPRSRLYGDVYFSAEDGLAESRAVFLQGCGFPQAWAGRRRFVVGELGFGTGLNILALLDLWRRTAEPGAHLHVFSIEAHPVAADEAARALGRWPELADLTRSLIDRWPGRARGFHRVELPAATLDLAVMDVEDALGGWSGQADAWFLDGFSPALNPAMWREEIMALVAARSAPGAVAATFTVAGSVRRGLAAAGFEVAKRPGFGRKRERLEARMPGAPAVAPPAGRVAVVGAGIAGASVARALRALGVAPVVIEAETAGAGASGNPAALVTPRLDAGLGPLARLFAQAFERAGRLYADLPDAILSRSVLQLAGGERDLDRYAKIAGSALFEPGALALLDAEAATRRLDETVGPGLDLATALVVEPATILQAWTGPVLPATLARIERNGRAWRLLDTAGGTIMEAETVILTTGAAIGGFLPDLPINPVRGQASWTDAATTPQAAAWGGYAVPTRSGLLFGATHDRGDTARDVRAADHDRNRQTLAGALPELAERISAASLEGRASVRATTPDHLPLAGQAPGLQGLYVLGGLGSRGFCLAPLLAEHVAAIALEAPSPLPAPLADLVEPERFQRRAARKGGGPPPAPASRA